MRRRSCGWMRCGGSLASSSEVRREGQTFVGESLLVRYVNFVKLPHTIFALPFALLGVVVASYRAAVTGRTLGLAVLAFTCARFVALGFNRIADRARVRSEEHTSELQSRLHLVCRLLLEKKKKKKCRTHGRDGEIDT